MPAMSGQPSDSASINQGPVFATTHWSVVLAAGQSGSEAQAAALEKLCRAYWYPLYAYVRRRGHGPDDVAVRDRSSGQPGDRGLPGLGL